MGSDTLSLPVRTPFTLIPALAIAFVMPASAPRRDLDVGIPPGSPTTWGQRLPALTPGRSPLFAPTTGPRAAPGGTVAQMAQRPPDLSVPTSFGAVRILTWDLMAHLQWIKGRTVPTGPTTGIAKGEAKLPQPGSGLYWISTAAFLRLLLHPQLVSETETIAHLFEIGEPVLGVLDAAAAEKALEPAISILRKGIGGKRRGFFPLPGKGPRDGMLRRWVAEELVAAHPYDPESAFGQRLFWFAEDLRPHLELYLSHPDPFLRRNATAALARYATSESIETMAHLGATSDDPVVLTRALASLGNTGLLGSPAPLVARLEKSGGDPVAEAALAQCLGRVGASQAVPHLLQIARQARRAGQSDRLLAAMTALARLPAGASGDDVVTFAEQILTIVRKAPDHFGVPREPSAPVADRADVARHRGEVMAQLALIALARADKSTERTKALLELLQPQASARRLNAGMGSIHPPAMMAFVEVLPWLGAAGQQTLERIADSQDVEEILRATALRLMPARERSRRATRWIEGAAHRPALAAFALDLLRRTGHDDLEALCRTVLGRARRFDPGDEVPAIERQLTRLALETLGERAWLTSDELVGWISWVERSRHGTDPDSVGARREVMAAIDALVEKAAKDLRSVRREDVDAILHVVVTHRLNPAITEGTRAANRDYVAGQLEGLKGHRADRRYKQLVRTELARYLIGGVPTANQADRSKFEPIVPLEDTVLVRLGRIGDEPAVAALRAFLLEQTDNPHRAVACLAAGITADRSLCQPLTRRLLDEDPFVRYCAYRALRQLTGQDYFADWFYGEAAERGAAASRYFSWAARNR